MTALCPTCGQPIDQSSNEAQRLLVILSDGRRRQVYRGRDGSGWYVTCGGGRFSESAVKTLIDAGHIHSCYSDCPNDAYHVGKTLDCKATIEERKKHRRGKDAPMIYTDGTRAAR